MMRFLQSLVVAAALLWAAPSWAAPVAYAFTGNTAHTGGAGTISVTVPTGGIPAGSGIYVAVTSTPPSYIGTVADTATIPNTYTEISGGSTTIFNRTQVFQAYNSNALTSGQTITYTLNGSPAAAAMTVFYVTGLLTTGNPFDSATLNTAVFNNTGSQPTGTVSGTPTVPGEAFLSIAGWLQRTQITAGFALDTANGWTAPPPTLVEFNDTGYSDSYLGVAGGFQVNAGTGQLTTQPTFTNLSGLELNIIILGLKPAPPPSSSFIFHPFP